MKALILSLMLVLAFPLMARDYKLGLLPEDEPRGDLLIEDRTKALEKWDWRDVNATNWLGEIMDQGNCGSCVAFTAVATLEAQYKISAGLSWLDPQFSTQQLFNCGGGSCGIGWQLKLAANMLKKNGVVDAACAPYESGVTGQNVQCSKNFCADQSQRITRIYDWHSPSSWGGSMQKLKDAIKKGPVMTGMTVYEDFMTYSGGIYKSSSKKRMGGHAVSIVGFNDFERYWIIRNSWGKEWGEAGFGRISYDDKSGIGESTFGFILKEEKDFLAVTTPENREFISGNKAIVVAMETPKPAEIIIRGEGEFQKMNVCDGTGSQSCQLTLESEALRDGRYEIYALSDGKKSQVKEFFVANSVPEVTITFTGGPGVDLSVPQKGRIEFDLDVKSTSVMPKEMELIVTNDKGEIVRRSHAPEVFPKMRLGLRTNLIPNGTYRVQFISKIPVTNKLHEHFSNSEKLIISN